MKEKIILSFAALFVTFALFSCEESDKGGKLDGDAKIWITGKDGGNKFLHVYSDGTQRRLTAEEICKGDSVYIFHVPRENTMASSVFCVITPVPGCDGYGSIDTVNMRLGMLAGNINGITGNDFLSDDYHVFITKFKYGANGDYLGTYDTIAYVPTSQRLAAYDELLKYVGDEEGNWDKIYKIFNDAFIFIPCTGEEYKAIEAAGLN